MVTGPPGGGTRDEAAPDFPEVGLTQEPPAQAAETALWAVLALGDPVAVTGPDGGVVLENPAWTAAGFGEEALAIAASGYLRRASGVVWFLDVVPISGEDGLVMRRARDVSALEHALARVDAYRTGVHALVWQAVSDKERERRRLAQWLHDGAIQRLVALRWHEQLQGADEVADELESVLRDLRRETTDLHDRRDVHRQLAEICPMMGATLEWDADGPWRDDVAQVVVRVCREALLNVVRHAQAQAAHVQVHRDGAHITVRIEDDGVGISDVQRERAVAEGHIGITSCEAVVESVGGVFSIGPRSSGGTLVEFRLPV